MGASTKKRKHQQFELSRYFKTKTNTNGSGSIRPVGRPIKQSIKEVLPFKVSVPLINPSLPDPQPSLFVSAQTNLPDCLAVKSGWRGDEGRIGDSSTKSYYKLLFATPTRIRLRLVRSAVYQTKRSCENLNGLSFAAGRRPSSKTLADCLTAVMRRLCEIPASQSFMEEFADFTVVHHPLCLRVINERIENHYYIYAQQWLADVRLIVENAWQSNAVTSEMSQNARLLWQHASSICRTNDKIKNQIPESIIDEYDRRKVLQAHLIALNARTNLPFPVGVRAKDLPKPVLRRLGRRSGRVPDEWPEHWKSNATAP